MLRIVGSVLFSDGGQKVKDISCPLRLSQSDLTKQADSNFQCKYCDKSIINTDFLTEDEIVELLHTTPDTCIYINLMNPVFKVEEDV